jgi:hypothetical protein
LRFAQNERIKHARFFNRRARFPGRVIQEESFSALGVDSSA